MNEDLAYIYDSLICDIDDTLIHGKFVAFMDFTWRVFKSVLLARLLAKIQAKFKFYNIDHKVAELIVQFLLNKKEVYFLTARSYDESTLKMLHDIIPIEDDLNVYHLASKDPSQDKYEWIQGHNIKNFIFIDDNLRTRLKCYELVNGSIIHPGDL